MIHTTQEYQIGDNVELMRKMSAESIDTIITSPPYYGLRDYGVDGQIGLEPTLEEYHARMLEVTAECMRVLKPTGVMFWNMGDSYANANTTMSEYSIDDEWLRLLGWIYTDGTVLRDGDKICIYQTKHRGIDEIERLLSVLNLEYSKYGPYKRNYQYYIHAPDSRRINEMLCFNGTKILPNWLGFCSRRQTMIMLQAIIDGDGTQRKYDTVVYGTEDRLLPLETLLNKKDISCKLWQNTRGDWILQIHQELWNPKFFHEKSMIMQNERLIIKMIDDQGWILRNRIIWSKSNGMPSSVTDRFSNKYEPVYMLVKSNDTNYYYNTKTGMMQRDKPPGTNGDEGVDWDWKEVGADYSESDTKIQAKDAENIGSPRARVHREKKTKKASYWVGRDYWFDLGAVRVPHTSNALDRSMRSNDTYGTGAGNGETSSTRPVGAHALGKNPGDVWTIPTQPYPESHFATFPTALIEPMIKVACPAEICPVCGMARERIVETESFITRPTTGRDTQKQKQCPECSAGLSRTGGHVAARHTTTGWTSCDCDAGWVAGTVLDPFCGSGTVLEVCRLLNRSAIGLELNQEYESLIKERSMSHTPPLTSYFGGDDK